jgi:peptidoglycan/LPS O-acetylase OafA/YrhL
MTAVSAKPLDHDPADPPEEAVAGSAAARGRRLGWLDALRGVGAICVVYDHIGSRVLPSLHAAVFSVFDPGLYGVLVFFLISGYIVPASLERRGCVRTFWVSRLFRLFPLFAFVVTITLLLDLLGLTTARDTSHNVAAAVLSHLFMLNDLLGGTNLIVVIWTLSYEMVFYLLVTALFTTGLHRRSGALALTFAAAALLLGGLLPTGWLSDHTLGLTPVALIADVLVMGGLAVAVATRGLPRAVAAWLASGTGVVLIVLNERRFGYEGLTILALMFTGTLVYRAQQGQVSRQWTAIVSALTFGAVLAAGAWHIPALSAPSKSALDQRDWIMSVTLAGLTFAAGLAVQKVRVPAALAWLGLVSYSVYLMLPVVLDLYDDIPFPQRYYQLAWLQAGAMVAFVAVLTTCAAMTYYLVESPMQRLGRRVATRI